MSATSPTPESVLCAECGEQMQPDRAVKGAYCSRRCYYINKGENAINQIQTDHRWCVNCFRPIKSVYRPSERTLKKNEVSKLVRQCFDGIQTSTQHATVGVDEFNSRPLGDTTDRSIATLEGTRLSCQCGTVNVRDRHEVLSNIDPPKTANNLWAALNDLEADGTLSELPTRSEFIAALEEEPATGINWAYVIGRALYG